MEDIRTKSTIIIQRGFRKYLSLKRGEEIIIKEVNNEREISSAQNLTGKYVNLNGENEMPEDVENADKGVAEIQRQINDIYEGLATFYKTLPITVDRTQFIDNVLANIDAIIENFQNISTIEDCEKIPDRSDLEEIQQRHEEALRKLNVKWWEDLHTDK